MKDQGGNTDLLKIYACLATLSECRVVNKSVIICIWPKTIATAIKIIGFLQYFSIQSYCFLKQSD